MDTQTHPVKADEYIPLRVNAAMDEIVIARAARALRLARADNLTKVTIEEFVRFYLAA